MFKPKFNLLLETECFYPDQVVCLGSQMVSIIRFLETSLTPHTWYGADVQAVGKPFENTDLSGYQIKKIGTDSNFIHYCSGIVQFVWGTFLCIDNDFADQNIQNVELGTEDEQFRTINCDGVLLEIRTFDTSFFEVYSENDVIIKKLSDKFKNPSYLARDYTWNDLVVVKPEAPKQFHPGEGGVICGMSKIKFEAIAKKYHSHVGDWIYAVKCEDGHNIDVPECFLEKYKK